MTQNQAILYRLKNSPNGLSPWEAAHDPLIGSMRLSGRIKDLRDAGYDIKTVMHTDGVKRYARYFLNLDQSVTIPLKTEPSGRQEQFVYET